MYSQMCFIENILYKFTVKMQQSNNFSPTPSEELLILELSSFEATDASKSLLVMVQLNRIRHRLLHHIRHLHRIGHRFVHGIGHRFLHRHRIGLRHGHLVRHLHRIGNPLLHRVRNRALHRHRVRFFDVLGHGALHGDGIGYLDGVRNVFFYGVRDGVGHRHFGLLDDGLDVLEATLEVFEASSVTQVEKTAFVVFLCIFLGGFLLFWFLLIFVRCAYSYY